MPVLINFKICDNCDACNAINVCPTGAFNWNKMKKTLMIDNEKCIECGLCATSKESCEVGAIRFAQTEVEFEKIKKEIENDSRSVADLMVDRYGGQPINIPFYCKEEELSKILTTSKLCMIEVFQEEYIECLIKSIPIKEIMNNIGVDVLYRKLEINTNDFLTKYEIVETPSLLFFKNEKMIGQINGYYSIEQKEELINKIKDIIK